MAKPIFLDKDYQAQKVQEEQIEIDEVETSEIASKIKENVITWLESQNITLDEDTPTQIKLSSKKTI